MYYVTLFFALFYTPLPMSRYRTPPPTLHVTSHFFFIVKCILIAMDKLVLQFLMKIKDFFMQF